MEEHKFVMERRAAASITGVKDVLSFDEKEILLESEYGSITVKGEGLHVKKLTLENGVAELEGKINSVQYSNADKFVKSGETLFSRLFK